MRLEESLERIVRAFVGDTKYHKMYGATVQGQSGMSLDLTPTDESIRGDGLSSVPILTGLPGFTFLVPTGTEVVLFFLDGDPSQPRCMLPTGSVTNLTFDRGTYPFARVNDAVSVNTSALVVTVGGAALPVTGVATAQIIGGSDKFLG